MPRDDTFEAFNRLKYDDCEAASKLFENKSQFEYKVTNPIYVRDRACRAVRKAQQKEQDDDERHACRKTVARANADGSVSVDDDTLDTQCMSAERFALDNKSMKTWSGGPGIMRSEIDIDSFLRNEQSVESDPRPQQLRTRLFTGVPDRRRGKFRPGVEIRLQKGRATSMPRHESEVDPTEQQFNVFHPTVKMPPTKHVIPPWTRGGTSSRDVNRSPAFLKSIGYDWDGRTWVRASSRS